MLSSTAKNSISLILASLVDKLSYVCLFAMVARKLPQSEFGVLSLFLTLVLVCVLIAGYGIENVIIREVAKDRSRSSAFFSSSLMIAFVLSLLIWSCAASLCSLLAYDPKVIDLIQFGGAILVVAISGQMASAMIKAQGRMEILAVTGSIHSFTTLILCFVALRMNGGVRALVFVMILTESLKAAGLVFIVHRHFAPMVRGIDRAVTVSILQQTVPFALLIGFGVITRGMAHILLGWLRPLDEVAVFGAVSKFADFMNVFSAGIVGALFPAFSEKMRSSRSASWSLYNDSTRVLAILGFGAAFSTTVLAGPIITLFFGEKYVVGAAALRWLAWAFLFGVLSGPAGTLLLAAGDQMYRLCLCSTLLLIINFLLNYYLIPLYSYNGAAVTACITAVMGFVLRLYLSRTYFGRFPSLMIVLWRPLCAGLVMALVLTLLSGLNVWILLTVGFLAFGGVLLVLGEFTRSMYRPDTRNLSLECRKPSP